MWALLLAAAQMPPGTPLPAAAEPAIDVYGKCVYDKFLSGMAFGQRPGSHGPAAMRKALSECAPTRAAAIDNADKALATDPAYADSVMRRALVVAHVDEYDAIMRETAGGGMDPDKW